MLDPHQEASVKHLALVVALSVFVTGGRS